MPTFTPPTRQERMQTREKPFRFFSHTVSDAVVWRNGRFQLVRTPSQEETAALVEGVTWFSGGRTYQVSDDTAVLLTADGFTTTPDLGPFGGL